MQKYFSLIILALCVVGTLGDLPYDSIGGALHALASANRELLSTHTGNRTHAVEQRKRAECTGQPCNVCVGAAGCSWCDEGGLAGLDSAQCVEGDCVFATALASPSECPRLAASEHNANTRAFLSDTTRYNIILTGGALTVIEPGFCSPGTMYEGGLLGDGGGGAPFKRQDAGPMNPLGGLDVNELIGSCNWPAYAEGVLLAGIAAIIVGVGALVCCCCFFCWRLCQCCGGCKKSYGACPAKPLRDPAVPEDAYPPRVTMIVRIATVVFFVVVVVAFATAATGNNNLTVGTTQFVNSLVNEANSILDEIQFIANEAQRIFTPIQELNSGNTDFDFSQFVMMKRDDDESVLGDADVRDIATVDASAAAAPPPPSSLARVGTILIDVEHEIQEMMQRDFGLEVKIRRLEEDFERVPEQIFEPYMQEVDADWRLHPSKVARHKLGVANSVGDMMAAAGQATTLAALKVQSTLVDMRDHYTGGRLGTRIDAFKRQFEGGTDAFAEAINGTIADGREIVVQFEEIRDMIGEYNSMRENYTLYLLLPGLIIGIIGCCGALFRLPYLALCMGCCGFFIIFISLLIFAIHWTITVVIADFCTWLDAILAGEAGPGSAAIVELFTNCDALTGIDSLRDEIDQQVQDLFGVACDAMADVCELEAPCITDPTKNCKVMSCPIEPSECGNTTLPEYLRSNVTDFKFGCVPFNESFLAGDSIFMRPEGLDCDAASNITVPGELAGMTIMFMGMTITIPGGPALVDNMTVASAGPANFTCGMPEEDLPQCAQRCGIAPGVCDERRIEVGDCATQCWEERLKFGAQTLNFGIPLIVDANGLWVKNIRPLLSCDRVLDIIAQVQDFICITTLNAFSAIAVGTVIMGLVYIPLIILGILGSKRYTNSFKKMAAKVKEQGVMAALDVFSEIDEAGTGELNHADVANMYREAYPDRTDGEINAMVHTLFAACDKDDSGTITQQEFMEAAEKDEGAREIVLLLQRRLELTRESRRQSRMLAASGGAAGAGKDEYDLEWGDAPPMSPRGEAGAARLRGGKHAYRQSMHPDDGEDGPARFLSPRAREKMSSRKNSTVRVTGDDQMDTMMAVMNGEMVEIESIESISEVDSPRASDDFSGDGAAMQTRQSMHLNVGAIGADDDADGDYRGSARYDNMSPRGEHWGDSDDDGGGVGDGGGGSEDEGLYSAPPRRSTQMPDDEGSQSF